VRPCGHMTCRVRRVLKNPRAKIRSVPRVIGGLCGRVRVCAAAGLTGEHPDYSALAARIAVSHLHKRTSPSFADVCEQLWAFTHPTTKLRSPLIAEDVNHIVQENREVIEAAIAHERDFE
jgi:hypothetical protein